MLGRERLDDEARLAIGIGVQHEGRLVVATLDGLARGHAAGSVAEARERGIRVRPAALHAYPYFEKDRAAEELLHLAARLRRDGLHLRAAFTQQYCPLA